MAASLREFQLASRSCLNAVAEVNCYGIRKLGGEPTQAMTGTDVVTDRLPDVDIAIAAWEKLNKIC